MNGIPYQNLDRVIASSGLHWNDIVSCYTTECKTIHLNTGISLQAENLLYYIRAMSRIILDYEFAEWNKKHSNSLKLIAAGSTNITSDYDVTLIGKKASQFVSLVLNKMSKLLHSKTHTMAEFADTNMYILPGIYKETSNLPKWFQTVKISSDGVKVPIPSSEVAKAIERHYIQELWKHGPNTNTIQTKYNHLIKHTKPLEDFYYSNRSMTETNYWHTLFTANQYAIEAYRSISAFLVVVVEMQMKHSISQLEDHHYFISAIENIIALKDHGLLGRSYTIKKHIPNSKLLQVSKYVQRLLYSLQNITQKSSRVKSILSSKSLVDIIVSNRSNPEYANDSNMKRFYTMLKQELKYIIRELRKELFDTETIEITV